MKCEILLTTEDGQKVAGIVTYSSLGVVGSPSEGYKDLMKNVMASIHEVDGKEVSAKDDQKAWFNSLPSHYNGSYLRARMVK